MEVRRNALAALEDVTETWRDQMEPLSGYVYDEAVLTMKKMKPSAPMERVDVVMQEINQECIDERFAATRTMEKVAKKGSWMPKSHRSVALIDGKIYHLSLVRR